MTRRSQLIDGAVAGLIGAAFMALWFIAIDVFSGRIFFTFRFVASTVFGSSADPLLFLYIAMHFVLLAAVGAVVNLVLGELRAPPPILLGVALGVLLFDVSFYLGVVVLGTDVLSAVGWPVVLTGNLLAGLGIVGYLRAKRGQPVLGVQRALHDHDVVREGLVTGLIGAAVVAIWFLAVDVASGRLLYTPAALGSAIFRGVTSPVAVDVSWSMIAAYSIVHLAAFVLIGMLAARLTIAAEAQPHILLGLILLFVTIEVLSLGAIAAIAAWLFETIPWWAIVIANLLSAIAMGGYLWRQHPALHASVRSPIEENLYRVRS